MSKKEFDEELYQDDIYQEAFYVTGQIGYLLLHDEIAKLHEEPDQDREDPRFR